MGVLLAVLMLILAFGTLGLVFWALYYDLRDGPPGFWPGLISRSPQLGENQKSEMRARVVCLSLMRQGSPSVEGRNVRGNTPSPPQGGVSPVDRFPDEVPEGSSRKARPRSA